MSVPARARWSAVVVCRLVTEARDGVAGSMPTGWTPGAAFVSTVHLHPYGETAMVRHDRGCPQTCRVDWLQSGGSQGASGRCAGRDGPCVVSSPGGLRHRDVKPLRGLGGHVLEAIPRWDGDAFRAVYTVRFRGAVYVLPVFRKKSKRGIATPKSESDLIRCRLRAAEKHYRENHGGG